MGRRSSPYIMPARDVLIFSVVDPGEYRLWEVMRSCLFYLEGVGQGSERGRLQVEILFLRENVNALTMQKELETRR